MLVQDFLVKDFSRLFPKDTARQEEYCSYKTPLALTLTEFNLDSTSSVNGISAQVLVPPNIFFACFLDLIISNIHIHSTTPPPNTYTSLLPASALLPSTIISSTRMTLTFPPSFILSPTPEKSSPFISKKKKKKKKKKLLHSLLDRKFKPPRWVVCLPCESRYKFKSSGDKRRKEPSCHELRKCRV
jgi:hypothetical protein